MFCKISSQDKKEIFEEAWKFIKNNYYDPKKGRIKLHFRGRWYFFQNFLFFQPSWKEDKQKESFLEILEIKDLQEKTLLYMDRTINKFLPSAEEFSNLSYTKSFITSSDLKELLPNLAFMLTFPLAFADGINTLFYSPDIKFTYNVNKKLKVKLKKLNGDKNSVFRITWEAILDSIVEMESLWSIGNMYLIKYSGIEKQEIQDVEYIGIPKLQASVILDERIREKLNKNIKTKEEGEFIWLLEEFIKGKPLYPFVLKHIELKVNDKLHEVSSTSSLCALAVDASIKTLNKINSKKIFSDGFFEGQRNYSEYIDKMKENYKKMINISYKMKDIFKEKNEQEKIVCSAFSAIKFHNKKGFLCVLIENLAQKNNKEIEDVGEYLLENIIDNDISWENFGLSLIINIL